MLSIGIVKSAEQAYNYFREDDYYTRDSPEAQGEWFGRGAASLGLTGKATPEAFRAVLEGRLPNGVELGTPTPDGILHTPGWDLTFSAPKSVSLLIEVGGDKALLEAHNHAVRTALKWVEDNAIGTREHTEAGRLFLRTGSMVATLFNHHTSRNQDPNTHTHAVVSNATEKEDGQWASLHSYVLFTTKMGAGAVYRADLAHSAAALGHTVEKTHRDGRFEIVGFPRDLIELMSTRRKEIESLLKKWGCTNDAALSALATLMSRESKRIVDREELLATWRKLLSSNGFNIDELMQSARAAGPQPPPPNALDIDTALKDAIDLLSESESAFSHANLVRHTLAGGMGRLRIADVEKAVRAAQRNGVIRNVDAGGLRQWTTPAAQERERRIIKSMLDGQGRRQAFADAKDVHKFLKGRSLSQEQEAAVEMILTSKDRFTQIRGFPGVGKTTSVLKVAREFLETRGIELVGMAQNANAMANLEEAGGIPSTTIDKHLHRSGRDLAFVQDVEKRARRGTQLSAAEKEKYIGIRERYRKQLWIVDEDSQVPDRLKRRMMSFAERLGAPTVFVGDHKQFGSIEAGMQFELLQKKGIRFKELTRILRQRNPRHAEAVTDLEYGNVESALEKLEEEIEVIPDPEERLKAMLECYRMLGDKRAETLLLTVRNAEKEFLNAGVRNILREEGKLTHETGYQQLLRSFSRGAERRDAMFYEKGWLVRFGQNIRSLGVKGGEYWLVDSIDKNKNEIGLLRRSGEGEKSVLWNPRKVGGSNKRATQVFKVNETTLAEGELVRWTDNAKITDPETKKSTHLNNGQLLRVVRHEGGSIVFSADGEEVKIDQRELKGRHWEHAYASTTYGAQGRTAWLVLFNAESSHQNLRGFLVGASRHSHAITIFTDDLEKLKDHLLNKSGQKTSATLAMERAREIRAAGISMRMDREWWGDVQERPGRSIAPL